MQNRDQRRHIRIEHSGTVELVGEGRRFTGRAVNISRTGMQVVINLPDSYESVRSITFTLPESDHDIELPCRIVRSASGDGNSDVVGLEFSYQAEAQLLLIENYIREMRVRELAGASTYRDMRQIPRTNCRICEVSERKARIRILSVDNISTEGLLMSYDGDVNPGDILEIELILPGDARFLRITGQVTYTVANDFQNHRSAGLRYLDPNETTKARIRRFIANTASSSAIKALCDPVIEDLQLGDGNSISNPAQITQLFEEMLQAGTVMNMLVEGQSSILESTLLQLNSQRNELEIAVRPSKKYTPPAAGITVFFTYTNGGGHYFKTIVQSSHETRLVCGLPGIVLRSEKRAHARKILSTDLATDILLYPSEERGGSLAFQGRLVDISRNGFLCQLELSHSSGQVFSIDQLVSYQLDERWGLEMHGQIRHMQQLSASTDRVLLQLGIESGIERCVLGLDRVDQLDWEKTSRSADAAQYSDTSFRLVEYLTERDQRIRALVNATRFSIKAPVIVLPPGFGRKKETLSPLVATLLANFKKQGKDVVTIRYDGVDKPGESDNTAQAVERGYEMIHYRIEQGIEDLKATFRYIYSNPLFHPEKVILVTFSMAALDARRYLAENPNHGVDLWISAMGVPAAKSTLQRILGGLDIICSYKMGYRNGLMGVLGHLIDVDSLARGLVDRNYAYMTDARRDMANISIPAIWIYGSYDKWVDEQEVVDLMSINSDSNREVIEVPAGHNLHTSDDALKVYRIVGSRIYRWLHKAAIDAVNPNREDMMGMITAERERLQNPVAVDAEQYWKSYLIGQEKSQSGYDFYNNFIEFREFIELETRLADLRPGDRLIDLGCGTGVLLEAILERAGRLFTAQDSAHLTGVDLVPEALARAREKCNNLLYKNPNLAGLHFDYVRKNLEPSRWLPVYEFICNPELGYGFLRNRIEGMRNSDIDKLLAADGETLRRIMRGELDPQYFRQSYEARLGTDSYRRVVEFSTAARFIRQFVSRTQSFARKEAVLRIDSAEAGSASGLKLPDFQFLQLGDDVPTLSNGFPSSRYTKLVASLFLSYLYNPEYAVAEFYRMLTPGGTAIISTMKPDSDVSMIFTHYTDSLDTREKCGIFPEIPDKLSGAMTMLNEAAGLFELEQDGFFRFFSTEELVEMCENCGFQSIQVYWSLGTPPQALVLVAKKP